MVSFRSLENAWTINILTQNCHHMSKSPHLYLIQLFIMNNTHCLFLCLLLTSCQLLQVSKWKERPCYFTLLLSAACSFQSCGEMRGCLSWSLWVASVMLVLLTLSGCLMPSSHLFLGLPLGLEPDSWLVYVWRAGRFGFILIRCANHLMRCDGVLFGLVWVLCQPCLWWPHSWFYPLWFC